MASIASAQTIGSSSPSCKKDRYPLLRIDDLLEKLEGADYISAFDLASGFWQIPIYPPHKKKTAFIAHCSFCQYRVMPFGFCNAPVTFQLATEQILADYFIFTDDVIVQNHSSEAHLAEIRLQLELARRTI